ncbi:Heterogeneous nuclear ribonucleoprotein F [Amphibalanus amphitrite]|uniref:Heterogeneous nuclear ribonucleoprotein F n=1 Tax=Amphibalanus amphitrite TaxID=1232801 RepID=A0A6A4VX76_AMPAM|nr:Heterogeneous nuclear ribonucleoprotein F [Amphibalanus amphitrite]
MSGDSNDEGHVIRLRGLPWAATEEDIIHFFGVFRSKRSEMEWVMKRSGVAAAAGSPLDEGCLRLRGLPYSCSKEEIANFFSGLEVVPNGITIPLDGQGRSSGEAYVQFVNREVAERAMAKNKEKIGHRYIEIFRSSLSEVRSAQGSGKVRPLMLARPTPYDRGDRGGGGPGPAGAGWGAAGGAGLAGGPGARFGGPPAGRGGRRGEWPGLSATANRDRGQGVGTGLSASDC